MGWLLEADMAPTRDANLLNFTPIAALLVQWRNTWIIQNEAEITVVNEVVEKIIHSIMIKTNITVTATGRNFCLIA